MTVFGASVRRTSAWASTTAGIGRRRLAYYRGRARPQRAGRLPHAEALPEQLGGLTEDEIYGIGPSRSVPGLPVIEVAADGATAKNLWFCQGAITTTSRDLRPCGTLDLGCFAVDFVRRPTAGRSGTCGI